jgi:hypothetical protein
MHNHMHNIDSHSTGFSWPPEALTHLNHAVVAMLPLDAATGPDGEALQQPAGIGTSGAVWQPDSAGDAAASLYALTLKWCVPGASCRSALHTSPWLHVKTTAEAALQHPSSELAPTTAKRSPKATCEAEAEVNWKQACKRKGSPLLLLLLLLLLAPKARMLLFVASS